MANCFKTILSSMPSNVTMGDLLDITRLALRVVTKKKLKDIKSLNTRDDMVSTNDVSGHDIFNMVSHQHQTGQGKMLWFMLAAACYVRTLQVSGYFGVEKTKVPATLTEDELMIGGVIVDMIEKIRYNCHSVTEATDCLPKK